MEYIESLRLFRTIVEVKNFRRAGEILGLSPSVGRNKSVTGPPQ